jgi:hypothetical protein
MRPVSRGELAERVEALAYFARRPAVPPEVHSAVVCRDEPDVKQLLWETDTDYWLMSWGRPVRE